MTPKQQTSYRWMYERANPAIVERTAEWLKYQGLDGIVRKEDLDSTYWVSEKQRNTEAVRRIGTADPNTGYSYVRPYDPGSATHEATHHLFEMLIKDALKEQGVAEAFSEPLCFLVQVAAFGNQEYARKLLGQSTEARSPYLPSQDELGNLLIRGYFVAGRNIFPIIDDIISGKNPQEYRGQIHNLINAQYGQLGSPPNAQLKKLTSIASGIFRRTTNKDIGSLTANHSLKGADPVRYLQNSFNIPESVSRYIVTECGFTNATQAATSLAEIKIESLDAFRAISSRLYILAGMGIKDAETVAAHVVTNRAAGPILRNLDTLEENIAAMYELGIDEASIRNVLVNGLTRPGYTENMKGGLRSVLELAGDMPKVGGKLVERYLEDEGVRALLSAKNEGYFLSKLVGEDLNRLKGKFGAAIAQETVAMLLDLPLPSRLNKSPYFHFEKLNGVIGSYSPGEEAALWRHLPTMLALGVVRYAYGGSKSELTELLGFNNDEVGGYDPSAFAISFYRQAKAKPGTFSENLAKVVDEAFKLTKEWLIEQAKPAPNKGSGP